MNMTVFQLHVDSTDGRVKTYYSRTGVHDDDDDDADWFTQGVNECRIPEPLPGMSEMVSASNLNQPAPNLMIVVSNTLSSCSREAPRDIAANASSAAGTTAFKRWARSHETRAEPVERLCERRKLLRYVRCC